MWKLCPSILLLGTSIGKQVEKPYLLGYRSLEPMNDVDVSPEYETHLCPQGPVPEWKKAVKTAKELSARGEHFVAISNIEAVINSHYFYGRMGNLARYSLHLTLGMCLLQSGDMSKAESAFYTATSLHEDSHAAHKGLALFSVQVGQWDGAIAHWKNSLFLATEQDSEYLQRLGALLILNGRLNEGRHYLDRAISQWELAQGPSRPIENRTRSLGRSEYSWFVRYLVGAATALSWPPHGVYDGDVQSTNELRLLTRLLADPSLLDGSAFLELSEILFHIGAYPESDFHLRHAIGLVKEGDALAVKSTLRLALQSPWQCERSQHVRFSEIPTFLKPSNLLSSTDVIDLQDMIRRLLRGGATDTGPAYEALAANHANLRTPQPVIADHRPRSIGLLVESRHETSFVAFRSLVEVGLHVTVFTTLSLGPSELGKGAEIVELPGDWLAAAALIRSRRLSVMLFDDAGSGLAALIGAQRVASHHVVLWDRGAPSQFLVTDFYATPEFFQNFTDHQTVSLPGLGLPWSHFQPKNISLSPPRYQFHGQVFFNHMRLVLIAAPFDEFSSAMDEWVVTLLRAAPQIYVVFLVDSADLGGRAYPSQWHHRYLQHIRSMLGGDRDAQARLRLMPYLDRQARLSLMRISHAFLDSPFGGTTTVLDALSVGTPVLTCTNTSLHGFAQQFLTRLSTFVSDPVLLGSLVFNNLDALTSVAQDLVGERHSEHRAVMRQGFEAWSSSPVAKTNALGQFLRELDSH